MTEGTTVVGGFVVRDDGKWWMLNDSDQYNWLTELKGWHVFEIPNA